MKVLLILADGMRPDSMADLPQVKEMIKKSSYTMKATTVFPSVTLPCHMSLFHSVDPTRHGTTTNIYAPQVRPIAGICEALNGANKKCAFFYSWHELRDLVRPGTLVYSKFVAGRSETYENANKLLTDDAINYIREFAPDFSFVYYGWPDYAGHAHGWMGEEYMISVQKTWEEIQRLVSTLPEDYVVMVTADHGGHDRIHGTELTEDMTIPVIIQGGPFEQGKELENVNIKDIAPTIASLLKVQQPQEWEGKVLYDNN